MRQFLLVLVMSLWMTVYSQRVVDISTGEISTTAGLTTSVNKTVTPIEGGYKVSYCFDKAALLPDSRCAGAEECILEGFTTNQIPGYPAFPYAADLFFVPEGNAYTVKLLSQEWILIDGKPSPGKCYRSVNDSVFDRASDFQPILPYDGFFPSGLVEEEPSISYRDSELIKIGITPVQYDYVNEKVRLCKSLEYEVLFSKSNSFYRVGSVEKSSVTNGFQYDPYLSLSTLNYDFENSNASDSIYSPKSSNLNFNQDPKTYLIISIPGYASAIKQLASWKKTIGFNVIERYNTSWSSASIKQTIKEIQSSGISIDYLLLIGNHSQVPSNVATFNISPYILNHVAVSDLYYTTKSNTIHNYTDIIPQFSYGRLPVNNAQEALCVIDKVISYEKSPYIGAGFYDSNLFISRLECNSDGVARRRNTQTAYELSRYMRELDNSPELLFYTMPKACPKTWSDYSYIRKEDGSCVMSFGKEIPAEIQKPHYAWNATNQDITTAINNGKSLVFYFSHGLSTSWSDFKYTTSSLEEINNQNKLPLILSMSCFTSDFSATGCLGEKFLTKSNGGAVAFLGFTDETYTTYTDMFGFHLFNGIWPTPGVWAPISWSEGAYTPSLNNSVKGITELGTLHRYAITKTVSDMKNMSLSNQFNEYQAAIFSLFGDPGLNFYSATPIPITVKSIVNKNDELVITPSSRCTLTVYDKNTGSVTNTYITNSITIPSASVVADCVFTLHSPGMIPYTLNLSSVGKKPRRTIEEGKMIAAGKEWKYYTPCNWYMCEDDPQLNTDEDFIYINMRFSGTVEVEGQTYLKCYLYKERDQFDPETAALAAYMREEDNRIYVRYLQSTIYDRLTNGIAFILHGGPTYSNLWDYEWKNEYSEERCIYDFNLEKGDRLWLYDGYGDFTVDDIKTVEYDGKEFEQMTYHNEELGTYSAIQTVGPVIGLVPFPNQWCLSTFATPWELWGVFDEYQVPLYLTAEGILGLKDMGEDLADIFYSGDMLRIKTTTPTTVSVSDSRGRTVFLGKCDGDFTYNTSELCPGIYIVSTSTARKKIIVR